MMAVETLIFSADEGIPKCRINLFILYWSTILFVKPTDKD